MVWLSISKVWSFDDATAQPIYFLAKHMPWILPDEIGLGRDSPLQRTNSCQKSDTIDRFRLLR
jgi:hypothetical protein